MINNIIWGIGLFSVVVVGSVLVLVIFEYSYQRVKFFFFREDYYYLNITDEYNCKEYKILSFVLRGKYPILYLNAINPPEIDRPIVEKIYIWNTERLIKLTDEEKIELL